MQPSTEAARARSEQLERDLEARTREVDEARQQQAATADVLKVISRSAFDLAAVLETLTRSATALCKAALGVIFLRDGDVFRAHAAAGGGPDHLKFLKASPRKPGRDSVTGRVALSGAVEHVPDVLLDTEHKFPGLRQTGDFRALLGVPLLRDSRVDGVFLLGHELIKIRVGAGFVIQAPQRSTR